MSSVFFTQGTVLDLQLGSFSVPVAALQVFNALGILILVPLFDRIVYPFLRAKKISISMLDRIGYGYLLATLSVLYTGCIEVYRNYLFHEGEWIEQEVGSLKLIAVKLSVFVQVPSYFLISAGEVMSVITGMEFAYSQSPPTMKSMVLALFYLTNAIGSYLGSLLVFVVNKATSPSEWLGSDLNRSHMDLYFFLLSGIGFVNYFIFLLLKSNYTNVDVESELENALKSENHNNSKNRKMWDDAVSDQRLVPLSD
eukprot:TRINITY_DN3874_c0_g2_i3.p2 TRINITY_DN3874_c0_g2~~TRINITY_DN3874_c0_g2_i3.p2  ORF type:complete len:254 (-),score=41.27 TRINITY_DN3874_c0_g2_i3:83-844(-)